MQGVSPVCRWQYFITIGVSVFLLQPCIQVAVKSVFWSMALPSGVPAYRQIGVLVVMIQDVIAVTKTQLE